VASGRRNKKIAPNLMAMIITFFVGLSHSAVAEQDSSTLASSSCLVEKGYRLYPSRASTKATKNVGRKDLRVQCLGAPGENRQMIAFAGKKYFIDSSGVISQRGFTYISEEKYRVKEDFVLWADAMGEGKKGAFYNSGIGREFIQVFQTAEGQPIIQNGRAQVMLNQRNRRGKFVTYNGWVSVEGIQEFQVPSSHIKSLKENDVDSVMEDIKAFSPLLHSKFTQAHQTLKKSYKQSPISQIGSNPQIYILKENTQVFDRPSALSGKVIAELEAYQRLDGFLDVRCVPNHGCMTQIQLDSSPLLKNDKNVSKKIVGWIQNEKTVSLSARSKIPNDTLAMSFGSEFDGVVQVSKGSEIVDLNLEICLSEVNSCFHRVLLREVGKAKDLVAWILVDDFRDPVQKFIAANLSAKSERAPIAQEDPRPKAATKGSESEVKPAPQTSPTTEKVSKAPLSDLLSDEAMGKALQEPSSLPEEKGIQRRPRRVKAEPAEQPTEESTEDADIADEEESNVGEGLEEGRYDDDRVVEVSGAFQNVVCLSLDGNTLNVKDESFNNVLFTLNNGEKIKVFQSFGSNQKKLGRKTYDVIKIQDTNANIGWVSKEFISLESECNSIESERPAEGNTGSEEESPSTETDQGEPQRSKLEIDQKATVCTSTGGDLSVYNLHFEKLEQKYFLSSGDQVTVKDNLLKDKPKPNGYKYIQIQDKSGNLRYVAKDFLTTSKCASAIPVDAGVSGGYIFPTTVSTGYSYISNNSRPYRLSSLTRFSGYRNNWGLYGARRSGGGRAHAATDLYQPFGLTRPSSNYSSKYFGGAFRAMKDGKVVREATYFYLGTSYIVVHHADDVVSRYGEIYPGTIYRSKNVRAGQTLGYIKWVGVGAVPPMLHFENYKPGDRDVRRGVLSGSKRINRRNSQRSKHLFDRTSFMKSLERKTFGK